MCLKTTSYISASSQLARVSIQSMFYTYKSKNLALPAWKLAQTRLRIFPTVVPLCIFSQQSLLITYCKQAKIRQLLNQILHRQAAIAWLWRWSKIESQCTLNGLSPGVAKLFLARIWGIPLVFFFICKLCMGEHENWTLVIGNHMGQMITRNVPLWSSKCFIRLCFVLILIWTFISIFFCPDHVGW